MFSPTNYKTLANYTSDLCISIYIPTYRSGNVQEDRIRLKNALQSATQQLEARDMSKKEIHDILGRAENLQDDDLFMNQLSDGLAMFIAPDFFEYYTIPVDVNQRVDLGKTFTLRPLMAALNGDNRFFILALSQNEVRFFEATEHAITPVNVDDLIPENLAEAQYNSEKQGHLQFHSGGSTSSGNAPVYHGQGGGEGDDYNKNREQFFRMVDKGLLEMLHDERVPMILATTDEQAAMYRDISDYSHIVEDNVSGNVEHDEPAMIHEKAWAIMQPNFVATTKQNRADFDSKLAQSEASFALTEIIPAAINGRVETLYINKDYELYGQYNESDNTVDVHTEQQQESVDLLELAARKTYEAGGQVFNIPMEQLPRVTAAVNAVYRYNY